MMDGIFAGGEYVPDCDKVDLYACSFSKKKNWYWPSSYEFYLFNCLSKPNTSGMKYIAPVILAFWSEE